jgi:methionine synthase II (cobalamin-independent)
MDLPTEPIGSLPRPRELIEALKQRDGLDPSLEPLYREAVRDSIREFEATGSPVVTNSRACSRSLPTPAPPRSTGGRDARPRFP